MAIKTGVVVPPELQQIALKFQRQVRDFRRAAVGIGFQSPYPSHTYRKTRGNPHGIPESPYLQNLEILHTYASHPASFLLDAYSSVLLCVFSDDNEGKIQKMPLKPIQNSTLFGEIQTSTMTFIAYLTRVRLISNSFKNLHRIPAGPWGFITVPIPISMGISIPTADLDFRPWRAQIKCRQVIATMTDNRK